MTKNFIAAVVIGVLVLIIFAYFIFGLNGSSSSSPLADSAVPGSNTSDTKPITTTQAPTTTSSNEKLQIVDEKIGNGEAVKAGDTVEINYIGTLTNGVKFDASADHGGPFTTKIGVGQVIKGWDEGVVGMKVGGKRKLTIPPSLGYGDQAVGSIPPNSTLIFEVELVKIK